MQFLKSNIANILTIARLLLLPLMIWLFFLELSWGGWVMWPCALLYILSALTDYLDGYIARKYNQVSDFGTFLDPISDKIFVSSLLLMLIMNGRIFGLWILLVVIIFAREFFISGLREYLGPKNVTIPVTIMAKWKTASQMLSIGFLILGPYAPFALDIGLILLWIATLLTVLTGLQYLFAAIPHFKSP